ncbi:MAG: methylmalonyl-CoA mutase family protein [Desulfitobacteriaceae bacterium]
MDELGGAVRAIELGFQQKEIQTSAYRYQMDIERQNKTGDVRTPSVASMEQGDVHG